MDNPTFHKYIDIDRLGSEENYGLLDVPEDVITITEKVDGGNGHFRLWDGQVIFGSRNNMFTLNVESAQKKQFGDNAQWVLEQLQDVELNPDYIYYGEWMKKHTLVYDWAATPKFVGLDIYCLSAHNYIPDAPLREEFERLGIPTIPLLFKGKVSEVDITRLENFIGKTAYGECQMEGIVIKNYFRRNVYGRQLFGKLVRQEFKELNQVTFGGGANLKPLTDDTSKFIEMYYTEARIKKAIHRLHEEGGQPFGLPMMHSLPKDVIEDIFKEETWGVVKEFNTVRFDVIKKNAPKLCLNVLKAFLTERATESKGVSDNAV